MLIGRGKGIASSEITSEREYLGRRDFLRAAGIVTSAALLPQSLLACAPGEGRTVDSANGAVAGAQLVPTSFEDITTYNNYYEFGTDKTDPSENSGRFRSKPWTVRVDGLVKKPADYALEDLVKPYKLEDRIYRHRCVEAWSMVIPWQGFPLRDLIAKVQPDSKARFVEFTTVLRPEEMPGQRSRILPWPYVEALRMDEAMHPLTLLSTGLYGKSLLPQNGAPLRTVIPWKYGFKSTKSIVRIRFTEQQPKTTWNEVAPDEYGFYANVNPAVDHPRWTQSKERVIGGGWRRKETLPFNGYADQVASLYSGMDLRKYF
jgi:methionine sulfoxide reductase catalytic subunit